MGGGKSPKAPPPRDYYKETSDTLRAQVKYAGPLAQAEAEFRPIYNKLELDSYKNMLLGSRGLGPEFANMGLNDILTQEIMPSMSRAEAADASLRRESDIGDVERLGRRASEAYLNADPRTKALLTTLNEQVLGDLQTNGRLSADEQRRVEQQARAGYAQRGLGLGRQAVASELFSTQKAIDSRRIMQREAARTTMGLNKQFTADPFQAILGRAGQAFAMGNAQQQFGQGFAASIGPRLFNPESQYAADIQSSNTQAYLATQAAKAQVTSATIGAVGQVGSSMCWVAREVYGQDNFKWEVFRDWLLHDAPKALLHVYAEHGESFAEFIKDKPLLKKMVRGLMDIAISRHVNG
jgi:hypothetical protein